MVDEEQSSVKDLVIYRLSQNSLATVNDLHTAIEKQRNGISYHAVHKACRQLVVQGVLRRDKKMYLISPEWVERLCKFMDRVKASYSGQKFVNMAGLKEFFEGTLARSCSITWRKRTITASDCSGSI